MGRCGKLGAVHHKRKARHWMRQRNMERGLRRSGKGKKSGGTGKGRNTLEREKEEARPVSMGNCLKAEGEVGQV